jgi:hypothetical protein
MFVLLRDSSLLDAVMALSSIFSLLLFSSFFGLISIAFTLHFRENFLFFSLHISLCMRAWLALAIVDAPEYA